MAKKKYIKQLGKHWAFYAEAETKYTHLLPSVALVHDGQVLPTGISVRFLWFGAALVWVA